MVHVLKALEVVSEEAKEELDRKGFKTFPAGLEVQATEGVTVRWPTADSPRGFLSFASDLGVEVIYAAEERFDHDDLERLEAGLGEGVEGSPIAKDARSLIEGSRGYLDRLYFVGLWWARDGIIHEWSAEAEWHVELEDQMSELAAQLLVESESLRERDTSGLAERLAKQPEFQRARTPDQREYVARKLLPELQLDDGEPDSRWTLIKLAREARAIYEVEILPNEEEEYANRARLLMVDGKPRSKAAEQLGISDDRLKRILQTHPVS